ncbi:MAG: LysR family transcriptional regulator [Symbiopectobacterium sp.]|uniref:LysR family transcriptional regulator n=1 Tax=Symbiopectobacterium sp. TaxID=2952789 RepID=UPI0039E9894C
MDSKVLKHFLKIVQLGSLTAQIKKLEQHMGFRLLNRTNKGVSLTPEGQHMLPEIMAMVRTAEQLQRKVDQLRQHAPTTLHIALNSTFSLDINHSIMNFMMDTLHGYRIVFSSSESPENLTKLANGDADMGMVIGCPAQCDDPMYLIDALKVPIVAAMAPGTTLALAPLIKPVAECAYVRVFERFVAMYQPWVQGKAVYDSGSEQVSMSLMKSQGGVGMVSQAIAEAHQLTVVPDFMDALDVYLAMKNPLLDNQDIAALNALLSLPATSVPPASAWV